MGLFCKLRDDRHPPACRTSKRRTPDGAPMKSTTRRTYWSPWDTAGVVTPDTPLCCPPARRNASAPVWSPRRPINTLASWNCAQILQSEGCRSPRVKMAWGRSCGGHSRPPASPSDDTINCLKSKSPRAGWAAQNAPHPGDPGRRRGGQPAGCRPQPGNYEEFQSPSESVTRVVLRPPGERGPGSGGPHMIYCILSSIRSPVPIYFLPAIQVNLC